MVTLYQFPRTTSDRVRWLLDELAVPFESVTVNLMAGEHKKPEYLRINPNGLLPALVDGDTTVFESSAILLHVADKFGAGKVAPMPGSAERAAYYQWIVFTSTSIDPPALQVLLHSVILPEDKRSAAAAEDGRRKFADASQVVEQALGDRAFLVGDTFTAADVMMAGALYRAAGLGLLADRPKLRGYFERQSARPASPFQKE